MAFLDKNEDELKPTRKLDPESLKKEKKFLVNQLRKHKISLVENPKNRDEYIGCAGMSEKLLFNSESDSKIDEVMKNLHGYIHSKKFVASSMVIMIKVTDTAGYSKFMNLVDLSPEERLTSAVSGSYSNTDIYNVEKLISE